LISLRSLTPSQIFQNADFPTSYKHTSLCSCVISLRRLRRLTVAESAEFSLAMTRLVSSLTCFKLLTGSACWAACSSADTNCLSFFTWSNLDRLRPCSRHQLPVIVHMVKLAATAADTNCLSFFTWSNLDRLRPCNRHELPVIVHTINSEPLQLTSTACHFAHDQTQSQCSRHQLPVILHMTKLGQPASLQKAHSHYLASVQ